MEIKEIVNKLVGEINPLGCVSRDPQRLENLKTLCELINDLISQVDDVSFYNKDSKEHSVKLASDYAKNFLTQSLGIV